MGPWATKVRFVFEKIYIRGWALAPNVIFFLCQVRFLAKCAKAICSYNNGPNQMKILWKHLWSISKKSMFTFCQKNYRRRAQGPKYNFWWFFSCFAPKLSPPRLFGVAHCNWYRWRTGPQATKVCFVFIKFHDLDLEMAFQGQNVKVVVETRFFF